MTANRLAKPLPVNAWYVVAKPAGDQLRRRGRSLPLASLPSMQLCQIKRLYPCTTEAQPDRAAQSGRPIAKFEASSETSG